MLTVLSPQVTQRLIAEKHNQNALIAHQERNVEVREKISQYDQEMNSGQRKPRYRFGEGVLQPEDLQVTDTEIRIAGWDKSVPL